MPIPSRLSRRLYETFGDDAGADMVDWMQNVEAQRAELRELNELNYSRMDARLDGFDARLEQHRAEVDARFDRFEKDMHAGFARLEIKIEQRFADTMKWSFVFWIGSVLTLAGAFAAIARFLL